MLESKDPSKHKFLVKSHFMHQRCLVGGHQRRFGMIDPIDPAARN
jgi:hypothetical protein